MNRQDLITAIKESKAYAGYENFKKPLVLKPRNIDHLHDLYGQATRLGIAYIKQNPNTMKADLVLLEEIFNTHNKK